MASAVETFKESKARLEFQLFKIVQDAQKRIDRASDEFVESIVNHARRFIIADIMQLCTDSEVDYDDKIAVTMAWCQLNNYDSLRVVSDYSDATDEIKHIFRMVNIALEKLGD